MKRVIRFTSIIVILDQLLRFYFQYNFADKYIKLGNWGFTYKINYGIYLMPDAPESLKYILQIIYPVFIFVAYYLYRYYCDSFRISIWVDLSLAFFISGILGNIYIDKLLFGYIRDYFINPIAVSNIADLCIPISILLIIAETVFYKKSRILYKAKINKKALKSFITFIKYDINKIKKQLQR